MVYHTQRLVDIFIYKRDLHYFDNFGNAMIDWDIFLSVTPCVFLGLLVGTANYFKEFAHDDVKPSFRRFLGVFFSGGIISFISFAITYEFFHFGYLTNLAIASAVAFFGVDKVLEIIQKIGGLKK